MQTQDAATDYFFKLWAWVETNIRLVIIGAGIAAVVIALVSYYFWRQDQMEIAAGQAYTQLQLSTPPGSDAGQLAAAYLKIAADYPGTATGGRALVVGATTLFDSGKYEEAQAQFQKYLNLYPDSAFSASAALGVAACLEAQGKMDSAANAYERVVNNYPSPYVLDAAKFALAKIDEQRDKFAEAETLYQTVARGNPGTPLGSLAAFRAYQLRPKLSQNVSSNTQAAPFTLKTKP
jgi:TolA-binding protein